MNKKIKRIIAVALTISAFSTFSATTNFMTTKVYASTSDAQLKSIYLSDGNIDFSASTYSYTVNVDRDVEEIRISARPKNSDATVEIDGTTVNDSDNYREIVSLNRGKNTIKIKVTDDDDEDYVKTYTLTVYRGNTDRYDDIYLKSLHLSDGDINFDKYDNSYSTSVSSSTDRVTITAKPEESYYRVRINGGTVTDDDNYKKIINLSSGENQIDVDVQDHEEIRTYKLNITRGSGSTTDNQDPVYLEKLSIDGSNVTLLKDKAIYDMQINPNVNEVKITAEPEDSDHKVTINGYEIDRYDDFEKRVALNNGKNEFTIKVEDKYNNDERTYVLNITRGVKASNQWIEVNGKLQYVDALGNPLKNTWLLDRGIGKYYYLNGDGNKSVGWIYNNSRWYFLDSNGIMQTGWNFINGNWYYLESSGAMKTGWFKDYDGKWYYLNSNGAMTKGWFIYGNKYYHLGNSGAMDHDIVFEGYRLGSDGAWTGR